MSKGIEEHNAKLELLRLNQALDEPVLLIGGLAVQQYVPERSSVDIDIVCSLDTQKEILKRAYGDPRYEKSQRQTDLRPVYEIKDTIGGHNVYLGSKILERKSYPYIDYDILFENSVPFQYDDQMAENIRVPEPHALAFSKLISFIARRDSPKGSNDLSDFSKLTNHRRFSLNNIISLAFRLEARDFIDEFFRTTRLSEDEANILAESSLVRFQSIFPLETIGYIAEKQDRTIPVFAPLDDNFSIESFAIDFRYLSRQTMEYKKSKRLRATKNKIGAFYDQFHWTGDQELEMKPDNGRHLLKELRKTNVWRRYEVDFQRILNVGDEENVSITWAVSDEGGSFVPFISATISSPTKVLRMSLDAQELGLGIEGVQVVVFPMQGVGEPLEVIDIRSSTGRFEFTCEDPKLLHTYELRWTLVE